MTCFSSAAATTISTAATGSGRRDTADRGGMQGIALYLRGCESSRFEGCVNSASGNTRSTKFKGRSSRVKTFTLRVALNGKSTSEASTTEASTSEASTTEASTGKGTRSTSVVFENCATVRLKK